MNIKIISFEVGYHPDYFICKLKIDKTIIWFDIDTYINTRYSFFHFCSDVGEQMNWKHWRSGLVPMGALDDLRETYKYINKYLKLYKVWQ